VKEAVYDAAGRVAASRIGNDPWTCTTYDLRGRPLTQTIPAVGTTTERDVTYVLSGPGQVTFAHARNTVGVPPTPCGTCAP
jgi:YD repeat-containing protein